MLIACSPAATLPSNSKLVVRTYSRKRKDATPSTAPASSSFTPIVEDISLSLPASVTQKRKKDELSELSDDGMYDARSYFGTLSTPRKHTTYRLAHEQKTKLTGPRNTRQQRLALPHLKNPRNCKCCFDQRRS